MKIDFRSKSDITEVLRSRAGSYTPEWNMNTENPDIATVLALVYADMYSGTLKKINNIPLKNEIAFFNTINANLLPASPSEGYVSFSLSSDDVDATEVRKGTLLSASNGDEDAMGFETCDDILVSPAEMRKMYCVDDEDDYIGEYKDFQENEIVLFDKNSPNLQSHVMWVSHDYSFYVKSESDICLAFYQKGGVKVHRSFIKAIADNTVAEVEYFTGEEYVSFSRVSEKDGMLLLHKSGNKPAVAADENGFNVRINVKKVSALIGFSFSYIEAFPAAVSVEPDFITDGNIECLKHSFFPFGERFQLFNEIYFGSQEVLGKKGAKVTMNFDLSFFEIPIENQISDEEINWKWIANKGDFKEGKTYKISITEVIWEYYNGYGWSRLFSDNSYSDIFNIEQNVTSCFKSMTFTCPDDMSMSFAGSQENFYIRARIIKAENLYKLRGDYLSPHVKNLSFDYYYKDNGCKLNDILCYNCMEEKRYETKKADVYEGFVPFYCADAKSRVIYLGFSRAPDNGPFRILWDINENALGVQPELSWEYLSEKGWRPMNMVDETECFTKIGLTIFLDNHEFINRRIFGEELFWVRITDVNDSYKSGISNRPIIKSINLNTVRAINVDSQREEYFAMNVYTENAEFTLSSPDVLKFELYVNEFLSITEQEVEKLESEGRIIRVSESSGMDSELWVKWQEVNTFVTEDNNSRCYIIDRSNGVITFGNGRNGRIPSVSDVDNIRVVYTTGGGTRTNVNIDTIRNIERSIGFVSGVTNPKKFYGGCDTETVYEAIRRSAVLLRTQGKAVSARDFEYLTMNASRSIERVRCFSGRNAFGVKESGAVTLVVLRKENSEFSRIREDIKSYLLPRISESIVSSDSLYITEPEFITINVRAELTVNGINDIFELKKSVEERLNTYLNSFENNASGKGWKIGQIPNKQQLRSTLLQLKNVVYVKNIYVTTYISGADGLREIDEEGIRKHCYILPKSGQHDISVALA